MQDVVPVSGTKKFSKIPTKANRGFTLVEMLVVVVVFGVIAAIVSQSVAVTFRESKKSDTTITVKDNLDYALGIIERKIRNAESVVCPNTDPLVLDYVDEDDTPSSFSCTVGVGGFVAADSERLTGQNVNIDNCILSCSSSPSAPPTVSVLLTGSSTGATGVDDTVSVTSSIIVQLRTY